jgi:uncharacterized protein with GYD domain
MPTFVMLSTLGPDGALTLHERPRRLKEVTSEVEAMGGQVLQQYALLGQWDFLNIITAPDERTMLRITTALNARGTVRTRTMVAVDVDQLIGELELDIEVD